MSEYLYKIVYWIAHMHEKILGWNDAYEYHFSDKQLHFLVIGVLGMGMILVVHPLFTWLAKKNHILIISWIYVFTLLTVLTLAIEIGQKLTHTGVMEFQDIMFGMVGFLVMFGIFALIRSIVKGIGAAFRDHKGGR